MARLIGGVDVVSALELSSPHRGFVEGEPHGPAPAVSCRVLLTSSCSSDRIQAGCADPHLRAQAVPLRMPCRQDQASTPPYSLRSCNARAASLIVELEKELPKPSAPRRFNRRVRADRSQT
ncbi:MAG: hypothetical protein M1815_004764 [Lichina confinis]|nr:MAG: hypothetical protein M1815_004764 [Lichina confinis]